MGVTIFRVADNEHVVGVAKIDESDEEEIELEGGEETSPIDDAVIGESELDKPAESGKRIASFAAAAPATNSGNAQAPVAFLSWYQQGGFRPCPCPTTLWSWWPTAAKFSFFRNHGDENQIDFDRSA